MIPFSPPRIDKKIADAVVETLYSGWITTGPKTKLFEKRIAEYIHGKSVLCVSSGSAGLELMLRWFGVKAGDEVILPAYTYSATANVVIHCGAKPVFVDTGSDFNIDVDAVEKAITSKTKVIIPVDIAGFPCDYQKINSLVKQNDIIQKFRAGNDIQKKLGRILVLSDAAHSIGAVYKGEKTGVLTDVTVFSFHAVKNLTTAEGGAVCLNLPQPFNNHNIYQHLCIKSLHGQTKDALNKTQTGSWEYDVIEPGYKFNMTDIQAAMGLIELERYDEDMLVKRKQIFDKYAAAFSEYDWAVNPDYETASRKSSYHVYLLRVKNITENQRNEAIQTVFQNGVSVNVHFKPLPMMTYYRKAGYDINDFPVSYNNYERVISLPVYYDLTNDQADKIINVVIQAIEKLNKPVY